MLPQPSSWTDRISGKRIIQKTKLFQIISKVHPICSSQLASIDVLNFSTSLQMPKGALLHAHLGLTIGAKTLLDIALRHPAIHIAVPKSITSSNMAFMQPDLKPIHTNSNASVSSLTDPGYHPNTWVPLATARERFDAALGGPDGFDRWLISKMTINPSDAYITHNNNIRVRTGRG